MSDITIMLEAIETLSELLEMCKKAECTFRHAAEAIHQNDLRRLFDTYAKQRARFGSQLEVELVRLGGVLESSDATEGASRPGRSRWKSPTSDPAAIIAECAGMEDDCLRSYQSALRNELPAPVQTVIQRQIAAIVAANNRMHELQSRRRTVA